MLERGRGDVVAKERRSAWLGDQKEEYSGGIGGCMRE